MKSFSIFLLFVVVYATGCDKTNPICAGCGSPYPVPGVVEALIRDTSAVQDVFTVCDSLGTGISISVVSGYTYTSIYSADSITSFTNYLNSKSYIDTGLYSKAYVAQSGGKILIEASLYNMSVLRQADWIATIAGLQLTERTTDSIKYVRVNVPIGQEKTYAAKLAANTGIFKWASQMFLAP